MSDHPTLPPPADDEFRRQLKDDLLELEKTPEGRTLLHLSNQILWLRHQFAQHVQEENADIRRIKAHLNLGENNGADLDQ